MRRAIGGAAAFLLGAMLPASTTSHAAEDNWLQTYFDANGGCGAHRQAFMRMESTYTDVRRNFGEKAKNPEVFGKPAGEWSDADIGQAVGLYIKCEQYLSKRSCLRAGNDASRCNQGVDPLTAKMAQGYDRQLHEIIDTARQRAGAQLQHDAARQAIEAAKSIRNERMAEDAARRRQQELIEQTARDRAAAAEAERKAEAEEPGIAEAIKQADDARRAKEAAEQRLADVRDQIRARQSAARTAADQAQAAEASREQTLRQEAERDADARLPSACKVTLEQFDRVRFGMQLRQVNQMFGCQGKQTSGTRITGYGTLLTYSWDGNAETSVVTATFRGDSLQSKAQIGLE